MIQLSNKEGPYLIFLSFLLELHSSEFTFCVFNQSVEEKTHTQEMTSDPSPFK